MRSGFFSSTQPRATGARARGAVLLASLCGDGNHPAGAGLACISLLGQAKRVRDPDERFDALAAISALGTGPSIRQRMFIELTRTEHQPYDEILMAWAERELAGAFLPAPPPAPAWHSGCRPSNTTEFLLQFPLRMDGSLIPPRLRSSAGRPRPWDFAKVRWMVAGDAGIRCMGRSWFAGKDFENLRTRACGFRGGEKLGYGRLRLSASWRSRTAIPGNRGRAGPPRGVRRGRLGTDPLVGRRFGALLAGVANGASLLVEAERGSAWKELVRAGSPASASVLTPLLLMLPAHAATEVRVRLLATDSQPMTVVDALTFIDMD